MSEGGEVTAIVPVWNRRELLERLLSGLRAQTKPPAEVLVIDDGSTDGSPESAAAFGARTVRMEAHGGFARAVNRGIRESRTPFVAIVNNDVELEADWLERLLGSLAPDKWFATGRILQAAAPGRLDGTFDAVCRGGVALRVGFGRADGPRFHRSRSIPAAPFTAALFRADLFARAGLLDERFESYLEDVDFGLRCAAAGFSGVYVPDAVCRHAGSATLGRWHSETVRLMARNQIYIVAKHYPRALLWRWLWPVAVAQMLWGAVALRNGRAGAWLRGKCQGLRHFKEFRPATQADGEFRARIENILRAGEQEILTVEREFGAEFYWKLYFLLTGRWGKVTHE